MKLDGKVVLLTGASSGMGKDMALLFAKEGAKVVAVARRLNKLEELSKQSQELSGEILAVEGDVTKDEDIDNMVEKAMEKIHFIEKPNLLDYFETDGEARNFAASLVKM